MSDALSVVAKRLAEVTEELADRTEQVADLRNSQRAAELRAMRVLLDLIKTDALGIVEVAEVEWENPTPAQMEQVVMEMLDDYTDAQLEEMLYEADHNDLA